MKDTTQKGDGGNTVEAAGPVGEAAPAAEAHAAGETGTGGRPAAPRLEVAAVQVTSGGLRHELRATHVVWQREMIRFWRDRSRTIASSAQPLLFLFVLGTGLSSLVSVATPDVDFRTFLFPGVLATSVLFTAVFSGISIVWDREFGFLREMLVAPISSTSIMLGKCLGGASIATLQSLVILALAGLVGVPYDPVMLIELALLLFLMAFAITALGLVLAARVKQVQAAMPLVQLAVTPMMFLSGALFPLTNLPTWLSVIVHANPMTYAVQPLRTVVFDNIDVSPQDRAVLDPGIFWGDWPVPTWLQLALVVGISVALLAVASARFARTE
jgi:ABC-2 type transport system permease protein